jgi:hypothetical protein
MPAHPTHPSPPHGTRFVAAAFQRTDRTPRFEDAPGLVAGKRPVRTHEAQSSPDPKDQTVSTKIYNGYRLAAGTDPFILAARLRQVMDPARDGLT